MNTKIIGWIQIVGGVLALLYPGGGVGMMGIVGFGSSMMGGGFAVTLLALLFIVTGIFTVTGNQGKKR